MVEFHEYRFVYPNFLYEYVNSEFRVKRMRTKHLLRFHGISEMIYFVSDDSIQPATLIKTKIKIVEYQFHKTMQQQIESLRNLKKKKY